MEFAVLILVGAGEINGIEGTAAFRFIAPN